MHITVDVASGQPRTRDSAPPPAASIIFVAVDEDGRLAPVPTPGPAHPGAELEERWPHVGRPARRGRGRDGGQIYTRGRHGARVVTRRFLAAPTDVNWGGKVHGGSSCAGSTRPDTCWPPVDRHDRELAIFAGGCVLPPAA